MNLHPYIASSPTYFPFSFLHLVNGTFIHQLLMPEIWSHSWTPLLTPNPSHVKFEYFCWVKKSQFHCFFFRDKQYCKATNLDEMLHYILFIASYVFPSQHFSCCIIMWSFALTFICHARLHEGRRIFSKGSQADLFILVFLVLAIVSDTCHLLKKYLLNESWSFFSQLGPLGCGPHPPTSGYHQNPKGHDIRQQCSPWRWGAWGVQEPLSQRWPHLIR